MNASTIKPAPSFRIDWLDGLRGIACFFVMLLHYYHEALVHLLPTVVSSKLAAAGSNVLLADTLALYHRYAPDSSLLWPSHFILDSFDLGKVGVLIFFLLSGFLIPFSLSNRHPQPIKRFLISRFFRLYPMYWVSLLIIGFLVWPLFRPESIDWSLFLINLTMLQKFFFMGDVNGVAWTLQIELAFYGLCAALFAFGFMGQAKSMRLMLLSFLVIGLVGSLVVFGLNRYVPLGFPLGLSYMFLGYLSRDLFTSSSTKTQQWQFIATAVGTLALVSLTCWLGYGEEAGRYITTYTLALVGFLGFGLIFRSTPAWLTWLGEISYSVYLIHSSIALLLLGPLMSLLPLDYTQFGFLIFVPISGVMLVTLAISHLTYIGIEKPSIKLGKAWIGRLKEKQASALEGFGASSASSG